MFNDETPSEQLSGSLFDRIKDFFLSMWTTILETDPQLWGAFWNPLAIAVSDTMRDKTADIIKDKWTALLAAMGLPKDMTDRLNAIMATDTLSGLTAGIIMAISYGIGEVMSHQDIANMKATQKWMNTYRPVLPDAASLIVAMYRDPTKTAAVREMLNKHGYSDASIDTIFAASKSIPALGELKDLFLRGEIDEPTLNAGYKKYGFTDGEVEHLKKLFYPIPGYPDLIRMAVREAFYPDYVEQYGLLDELPGEFVEWAKKQGLSEEWSKYYWASHWELPSLLRGYEMLHRGVIEENDLDKLFMAQDIMPWWRDKLRAISYNPLTRVDVRRVYKMGIIDREQVKRTYLDLGYNDEKAEWLTKFTEMQNTEQDRDLSKAEILSAYSKMIISQSECQAWLGDLGYNPEEVNILISMKDYQVIKENKERELARIHKYYMAGAYTANQAITELGKLDLVGAEQDSLLRLWDSERLAKLRMPTKKELDSLYSTKIITQAQYREELKKMGYVDKYIEWFEEQMFEGKGGE